MSAITSLSTGWAGHTFAEVETFAKNKGIPYAVCGTAGATAEKTVSISGFSLVETATVAILFSKGFTSSNPTLNVSSTGAKPIYINGSALQPGVVRPGMTVTFVYDGTNYNIIEMLGLEQSASPSDLFVDMGLPSGLLWAKKNIDVTQADGFAASEYQYECSFVSWGNTQMYNPTSTSAFAHDFGTSNEGPYASTPGAALTGNMSPSFDAARANIGAPWRMPTTEEYAELFNSSYTKYIDADGNDIAAETANKLITINGITGIRLKSKVNGNVIFFPCSGVGGGTSWNNRGSGGYYWASSLFSSSHGRYLFFNSGGVGPQNRRSRFLGFTVRAVQ